MEAFGSLLTVLRDYRSGDRGARPGEEETAATPAAFFPKHILVKVLESVLAIQDAGAATVANALLIKALARYVDLYYYALKSFKSILSKSGTSEQASRIFAILRNVPFRSADGLASGESLIACPTGATPRFRTLTGVKNAFSACTLAVVALLPKRDYRKFVSSVGAKIIPHMIQPQMLSDFLSRVYEQGGTEAILALDGLFVLIRDHNLEFPKFYDHLYALIDEKIFHLRSEKAKFFEYIAVFMSSSMLPAYVVAGIVKRVARLCLYAAPSVIVWGLSFIYNMLLRYPTCRQLIHRESTGPLLDPYLPTAKTLAECRALESSLWEVKMLEAHACPKIGKLCSVFKEKFTRPPFDLGSLSQEVDVDLYRTILQDELSHRWSKRPPTEIHIPEAFF